jgi:GTP pyrophosphokinase
MFKSAELLEAARQSGFDSTDELAAAVGFGRVATSQVIDKLAVSSPGAPTPVQERPAARKAVSGKSDGTGVQVKGSRDLLMQLSRCCHPVPGDRILGYITRGRGLTIHAVDCPNLEALDYDKERLVEVEWDAATPSTHSVKMSIVAVDKTGVLANVSSAIAECHANISRAEIATREDQKAVLDFVVEVSDTRHLEQVLKAVERVDGVITARRMRAWQERP